jgi:cytochrome c oxidase subunit II
MLDLLKRWMPTDASAHGPALDQMTAWVHWLMAVLFVGWGLYFLIALIKFRAGRNPKANYHGVQSHFSTWTEVAVAVIEAVLLLGFAIPAWARWVTPYGPEDNPLVVRVVGEQFAWNVQYPGPDGVFGRTDPKLVDTASNPMGIDRSDPYAADDVITLNQLHLPVQRPITIHLTSKDVIHSFNLPVMRVKQDAIPGQEISVYFEAVRTNEGEHWEIACAQLCGLGHYRMRGFLTVQTQAEFDAWLAEQQAAQ